MLSPSSIQQAISTQAQLATFDLQYLIESSETWHKASVDAQFSNDDGRCMVTVSFPCISADETFSGTRAILRISELHDRISNQLLPTFFGENIRFIEYNLEDETLSIKFEVKNLVRFVEGRVVPINKVRPLKINETVLHQAYELERAIDFMISNSHIRSVWRLPLGHKSWDRFRLRESTYAIEHFRVNKCNNMVRLSCMATSFFRGSSMEGINNFLSTLENYLSNEPNVIDYKLTEASFWRGKRFIEARIIL